MKDSKRFVEVDEDFSHMMISAVRYALGRQTYVVSDTVDYIKPLVPLLTKNALYVMHKDIEMEAERCETWPDALGHPLIDKPKWFELMGMLRNELDKRSLLEKQGK